MASIYDSGGAYAQQMFSETDITAAVTQLPDYDRYADIATVSGEVFTPAVLKAFGQLAEALHGTVHMGYNVMTVRQQRPVEELRERAVRVLQRKYEESRA